jgi:hypothetical protein
MDRHDSGERGRVMIELGTEECENFMAGFDGVAW